MLLAADWGGSISQDFQGTLTVWDRCLNFLLVVCLCASSLTWYRARSSAGLGEFGLLGWMGLVVLTLLWQMRRRVFPERQVVLPFCLWTLLANLCLATGLFLSQGRPGSTGLRGLLVLNFAWLGSALLLALPACGSRLRQLRPVWALGAGSFIGYLWIWSRLSPVWKEQMLLDGYRFRGLSANPNQLALYLILLPPFIAQMSAPVWLRAMAVGALVWIGLATGSDALILAWAVMALLACAQAALRRQEFKPALVLALPAALAVFCWLAAPHNGQIATDFTQTETARENVSTRWMLVSHGLQAWNESKLFGWGPGAFGGKTGPFQRYECHNSLVDWLTNAGLVGLLSYGLLLAQIWKGVHKRSSWSLTMLCGLLVFSAFHYVFRQPIFWFALCLCGEAGTKLPSGPFSPGYTLPGSSVANPTHSG